MPDVDAIFEKIEKSFRATVNGASSKQDRRWQAPEVKAQVLGS